jgi:hypothetical protein
MANESRIMIYDNVWEDRNVWREKKSRINLKQWKMCQHNITFNFIFDIRYSLDMVYPNFDPKSLILCEYQEYTYT